MAATLMGWVGAVVSCALVDARMLYALLMIGMIDAACWDRTDKFFWKLHFYTFLACPAAIDVIRIRKHARRKTGGKRQHERHG